MHVNVTIPTYNRAGTCLERAIERSLSQTFPCQVTVIDDGSTDETPSVLERYASEPRFSALRLGRNVGTARAKNVSLLLSAYDAITFHDSDDVPHENKVLLQVRALGLPGHRADDLLDWGAIGHVPGTPLTVDVVVGAYRLVKLDGSVFFIDTRISLVDDFFPNLQLPSKTPGDWCLVNAGLFRRSVFARLGGYLDSIEEDRELRNRTLAAGLIYYFLDEPLLTKIEMEDSLTVAEATSYRALRRRRDREEVWRRNRLYQRGTRGSAVAEVARTPIDLEDLEVERVIRPERFRVCDDIPATPGTRRVLSRYFGGASSPPGGDGREVA